MGFGSIEKEEFKPLVAITAGLGCFFAWTHASFFMPAVSRAAPTSGLDSVWLLSNIVTLVMLAVLMAFHRQIDKSVSERSFSVAVLVVAVAGTALLNVGLVMNLDFLAHSGSLVASAANMAMMAMWAHSYRALSSMSRRKFATLAAMALSCALYLLMLVAPIPIAAIAVTVLPAASMGAYWAAERSAGDLPLKRRSRRKFTRSRLPVAMIIFFFIISVPLNFLRTVSASAAGYDFAHDMQATMALTLVLVLAVIGLEVFADKRKTTLVPLSIMTVFTLSLIFVAFRSSGSVDLVSLLVFSGYYLFIAMMYYEMGSIVAQTDVSPTWVFALGSLANAGGLIVGALLGLGLASIASSFTAAITLGITYVVIISVFVFLPNSAYRLFMARVPIEIEVPDNALVETIEKGCRILARKFDLSSREEEVLAYIARGRNLQTIGEEMHLSLNTIKTHVKHIYQKCDVHNQEELMIALEDVYRQ